MLQMLIKGWNLLLETSNLPMSRAWPPDNR